MTLVTATWPLMPRVRRYTGNPRGVALSAVMTRMERITEPMRCVLSLEVPPPGRQPASVATPDPRWAEPIICQRHKSISHWQREAG